MRRGGSLIADTGAAGSRSTQRRAFSTHSDGDALAVFAAGADAFVQCQIIADHGDVFQGFRAVADEGSIADGGGDFSVFDEVGFGGGEDEFSAGDVDLASAEVDGVEAAFDAA